MNRTKAPSSTPAARALARQGRLVHALAASLEMHDGVQPRHLETHISHVLLHGGFAYKIKKALATPFLDQSTLALRRHACAEELRLNRRLAPDLYLGVVAIAGTRARPVINGKGRTLEVAVKMRAFDQAGLWDRLAVRGELRAADVDELAEVLARFHMHAAVVTDGGTLGTSANQHANLTETLNELRAPASHGAWPVSAARPPEGADDPHGGQRAKRAWGPVAAARATLANLAVWADVAYARLAPVMARRRAEGRVRECHGDLHLGNVAREHGHCLVFDGIEFNERFRWIDVMSDLAFIAMDLEAHGLPVLAHRLVNAYLEANGDYDGVRVLGYHVVYRALVRAKVAQMRAAQTAGAARLEALVNARRYLELASRTAQPQPRALLITHGLSGSGKTTLSIGLVEAAGVVRVRADVRTQAPGRARCPAIQRQLPGQRLVHAADERGDLRAAVRRCCRRARRRPVGGARRHVPALRRSRDSATPGCGAWRALRHPVFRSAARRLARTPAPARRAWPRCVGSRREGAGAADQATRAAAARRSGLRLRGRAVR